MARALGIGDAFIDTGEFAALGEALGPGKVHLVQQAVVARQRLERGRHCCWSSQIARQRLGVDVRASAQRRIVGSGTPG